MIESEGVQKLVRRQVRSPRSAALAGILFSVLLATSMILLRTGAITVFARRIEQLRIDNRQVTDGEIEVGGMDYGFEIQGILGMDFLL